MFFWKDHFSGKNKGPIHSGCETWLEFFLIVCLHPTILQAAPGMKAKKKKKTRLDHAETSHMAHIVCFCFQNKKNRKDTTQQQNHSHLAELVRLLNTAAEFGRQVSWLPGGHLHLADASQCPAPGPATPGWVLGADTLRGTSPISIVFFFSPFSFFFRFFGPMSV